MHPGRPDHLLSLWQGHARARRLTVVVALAVAMAAALPARCQEPLPTVDRSESWEPVPFRVRNLTFPTLLVMGFKPTSVVLPERGGWAFEFDLGLSNNFQMSSDVEDYLRARGGEPRPLDESDVQGILDATSGDQFFIDGEFGLVDFGVFYGLTDTLALSLQGSYLTYSGGVLDSFIYDFHDLLGIGQEGRDLVADGSFQILFADDDGADALLERPTSGGLTDPVLGLRWADPATHRGWRFGAGVGIKLPLASSDELLSTGSVDCGAELTAERRWARDAFIANLGMVVAGDFDFAPAFEPSDLPSLNLAWVHRFSSEVSLVAQTLVSENIFREATDSELSALEFQLTAGLAFHLAGGRLTVGVTENLLNYDNTPDFAVHLGYAVRTAGRRS